MHFRKDPGHFFYFGKQVWKRLKILQSDKVFVEIEADQTSYQAEMPEEFEAVLSTDAEAMEFFDALTPGRQRSIIFMIGR